MSYLNQSGINTSNAYEYLVNTNLNAVMSKKNRSNKADTKNSFKDYNNSVSVSNSVLKSHPNISGIGD